MNASGRNLLKMTARDIRRNFLQYLSMIVITMLAVTLFCGFVSNTLTLDKRVNAYFTEANLTDLIAQFYKGGREFQIGSDDRDYFSGLVQSGEADSCGYRFYAEGSIDRKNAKVYAAASDNAISKPLITEGVPGVLVDAGMKNDDGYALGQTIKIELPALSALYGFPQNTALEFKITGFMNFAEVSSTHFVSPVFIDIDTLCGALREKTGIPLIQADMLYNQALLKASEPAKVKAGINARYSAMKDNGGLTFVFDHDTIESVVALKGEVKTSLRMIYVFPVIFLLVSILVITTTAGALILRERTNIGTLKGIGISNGRIMLHYAFLGAVLCFIGGAIGAAIGPFIVPNVMLIKYSLVYSMPITGGIVFSPLWSAAAVAAVCFLALLIGTLACRSVIREKPAECMRPAPPKSNFFLRPPVEKERGGIEKESGATRSAEQPSGRSYVPSAGRKGSLPLKMAVRNIVIKPSRALMTVAGVMGCVALLVCSFGIGDTVNNSVDLELGGQFSYDISAVCASDAAAEFLSAMDGLKESGDIDGYETYKTFYMSARSQTAVKDIRVYSLAEDSRFTTINPRGGVLISKSTADELKVKAGEKLTLTAGANTYDLEISGIVETAVTKGVFVSTDVFDGSMYALGVWIKADVSDALISLIKSQNGVQDAYSITERRESVNKEISSISTIKYTMMVFSIALSVVALYNLSLLNIKERHRSIATLKVLGFSDPEVSSSLFIEIMALVVLGTALGLLLGFPVLYLVLSINKIEIVAFIYHIKPVSYVLSALLSLVTAAGINLIFGLLIKRIKMIDSLKSVE